MVSSFHLVLVRPWPFLFSLMVWRLLVARLFWFHYSCVMFFILKMVLMRIVLLLWLRDVEIETWLGYHTLSVYSGIRIGIILFIVSEVFFFFRFFWRYFHNCLRPRVKVVRWPSYNFEHIIIKPFGLPLLNTVLLLSSGVRITYCHHRIMIRNRKGVFYGFIITLLYGFLFLDVQFEEYQLRKFSVKRMVYGTVFFLLTGFHGFHVILGMIMIMYCFFRFFFKREFSHKQHVSFEVAAWYWHFVDVVWLFLFVLVYWYGYDSYYEDCVM